VTSEGQVLTESAAIILWLLDRHRDTALMPASGSAARPAFYRWLVFISANIYAAIIVGDFPERWVEGEAAQASLKEKSAARARVCWEMMERAMSPSPWLLGDTLTALDIYVAMVSRWRPGRAWFEEHCPKMAGAVRLTEQQPVVASVWARNFD
jgi:GST-like protein